MAVRNDQPAGIRQVLLHSAGQLFQFLFGQEAAVQDPPPHIGHNVRAAFPPALRDLWG